jgi:hypothetical protein
MSRQLAGRFVLPPCRPSWSANVDGLDICVVPDDVAWLPLLTLHFGGGERICFERA